MKPSPQQLLLERSCGELEAWRSWARFVWLDNRDTIPTDISDVDLRRMVCERHDAEVDRLRRTLAGVETLAERWTVDAAMYVNSHGAWLDCITDLKAALAGARDPEGSSA